MSALNNGATSAQAAGLMFGGFSTLSGAARTLTHLPGLQGTALGEAAEQFTEGSITRQVAQNLPMVGRIAGPMVGAMLLSDRNPENTDYDKHGRAVSRAMLVPAVGEMLDTWTLPRGARQRRDIDSAESMNETDREEPISRFSPLPTRRMGLFTPLASIPDTAISTANQSVETQRQQERSDYAAEMTSEEMEQHITDVMRSSLSTQPRASDETKADGSRLEAVAARLEQSAESLTQAARTQMMLGQLKVSGSSDVGSVIGDVLRQIQAERAQTGMPALAGLDHLSVGTQMAQAMGVMPAEGQAPIQDNLHRFGLFTDQALRLGVSGTQAEQVIQEVKTSPEGRLSEPTRTGLIEQVRTEQNVSYDTAREDVNRLEHRAQMLPNEITAVGSVTVPQTPPESTPPIHVEPAITVQPKVNIVLPAHPTADTTYNEAMQKQSSMAGSGQMRSEGQ
jgi:hypothetical protein